MKTAPYLHLQRQRGVALPVMLIMMLVMLITGVYLLRSSNSATLAASNLAYDSTLSRAVDLGLHRGFQWLQVSAKVNRGLLTTNQASQGYRATLAEGVTPRDSAFWAGSTSVDDGTGSGNRIEYVIHRLCDATGLYNANDNTCVQTAANTVRTGNSVAIGESMASDAPIFAASPQLHYVITARLDGVRGGNVINQMVVLIGA